jgi:Flp pilus assembly protein TadG
MKRGPQERGSVSVELAVLAPVLLALLAFIVAAGRAQVARAAVADAARSAARDASLSRDAVTAEAVADDEARRSLAEQDINCTSVAVDVDTSAMQAPLGQSGDITVTITCTVGMGDLLVPGLPGSIDVNASFSSPVDAFRER